MKFGRRIRIVGIVAALLGVWGAGMAFYAESATVSVLSTDADSDEPDAPAEGITLYVAPTGYDASKNELSAVVSVDLSDELRADSALGVMRPDRDIHVLVTPSSGGQQLSFKAGEPLGNVSVTLYAESGDIYQWPIDNHGLQSYFVVTAGDTSTAIPVELVVTSDLVGWDMSGSVSAEDGYAELDAHLTRSVSTVIFGGLLLALLVAMPVLTLTVTLVALREGRKAEPTMFGWMGAMIFAVIPIRNFLPGNPPHGSWIDAAIVVWVLVALVTALAIYVSMWVRRNRTPAP